MNRIFRRPRWLTRPVGVLIAVVVGLGGLGGATGAVLGELGSAGSAEHGIGHGDRHGHFGQGDDGDGPGGVVPAPPGVQQR